MTEPQSDRRVEAFLLRHAGSKYREIADRLGGISVERARQLARQGAKQVATSTDPRRQAALEFVQEFDPDFRGNPLEALDKHTQKLISEKGGVEELSKISPLQMLRTKNCGRKRLRIITNLLRDAGLDWKFDKASTNWWKQGSLGREFPLR